MKPSKTSAPLKKGICKRKRLIWGALILSLVVLGGFATYRRMFPYGWSHCCSKIIGQQLRGYALEHNGWLPHGQRSPEASLSLLCSNIPSMIEPVRGKSVGLDVASAALARDGVLGPNSCGWHYVEGLRDDDDPNLAVVWDKVTGLNHNGRRTAGQGHEVVLLDGSAQGIPESIWPQFIAEQKKLLAKTASGRTNGAPPLRWSDEQTLGPNVSPL